MKPTPRDQPIHLLPIFLMEQIVKRYRSIAQESIRRHEADLSVDQWLVLKQISENNGCSQVDIAESTVKDAPTTTRIIDHLGRKELIHKELDPQDRRRYRVFTTSTGDALIDRLMPVVQRYRQIPERNFSESDRNQMRQLLLRMLANLEED